ncbi:WcaI family glycosyltransferase [Devosia sp. YIM 151766]|uniref:WcaI family glycosyltransferase n=1 Tax=Devosia sp. YIM 151766 TaxID=3017325 RepID=UPI00255C506E|nr:WcaI family glycosyltransferase [Devosia sp. YIM 151766]WIY51564.1 WcaI family glycosyltransferase [Devosia sp. YIM 151766]
MKLLILGLNYAPEPIGIAVYTTGMAEALAGNGHEVQVVAACPYYPGWKIMAGHSAFTYARGSENGVDVTRVPHYIPAGPSGGRRLLHHCSFGLAALFPMLMRAWFWRPDVVMSVAPSLIAAPVARLAAGPCGAKSWLHIQDFETEAAFATGLLRDGGPGARLARFFERAVLNRFDIVSTISPFMGRRLAEKGVCADRIVEFRNWADLDAVQPGPDGSDYRAEWGITTPHVALYSGNIANKQGTEIIVEVARRLRERTDLTFVVCGEGPNRANLEARAAGLTNIQFRDLQPKERLGALLGLASIHLLPQIAGAADLMLPSKLANMLASGRPVIATAAPGTGLATEMEHCGLCTMPGDIDGFVAGISRLLDDAELCEKLGAAARNRAQERWGKAAILNGFERQLGLLCEDRRQSAGGGIGSYGAK